MKVLIVAKTRRGGGACVGGITWDGRSVRLIASDASRNDRAGLEYQVGEVWDLELAPDLAIVPPHVENMIVQAARRSRPLEHPRTFIRQHMPPAKGPPSVLFEGLLQCVPGGGLYIAERTGLPSRSTMFWVPDQPMQRDLSGKRIRYRYPTAEGGCTLTFVGFQEPVDLIPAGTLLRVSLAHWWRPKDKPDGELRCYAQLSGWFEEEHGESPAMEAGLFGPIQSLQAMPAPAAEARVEGVQLAAVAPALTPSLDHARQALKRHFGFSDFLPTQQDVIRRVLQRQDTLVIMPTGGGRSLCYQLPALLFQGLTVVVSPLIALMADQVSQLRELGIPAAFLNSTLLLKEYVSVANRARRGELKLLYAAPETLLRPETVLLLEQCHLSCLAVDEAHCISEWGHDFRPEYRQLHDLRGRFPDAVCVALTATATPRVREDVRQRLGIEAAGEFVASFNRSNLLLSAQPRHDGLGQILRFLQSHRDQSGIIYCATRQQVDSLAAELEVRRWPALPYHAGLSDQVRRENQEHFIRDDAGIMVATIAFGMGINKSNVRFVAHYNLPQDIESYYQEIGRAGRDGLPADCLLLHSHADAITVRGFIDRGAVAERPGRQARLESMLRYAEGTDCRRIPLLKYFGETLSAPCGHCDNCLSARTPTAQTDVTEAAQKFLSCVKRTKELFGPAHIIEILRGSHSKKVVGRGHDQLSTYGIGREFSARQWGDLAQQFIGLGLVEQDLQFGSLRLTPKGWQAIRGEKVFVRLPAAAGPSAQASADVAPTGCDPELFEALRVLRRQMAAEANVPSYVIFSDRALVEMATQFPRSEQQFLMINGVGQTKLARYGAAFLAVIASHCQEHGLEDRPAESTVTETTPWQSVKRRFEAIGEQFASGRTLGELAEQYGVQPATIATNLQRFCQEGGQLEPSRVLAASGLSAADRERVIRAFEQLGVERLSPVREALGGTVSYQELHLLRVYMMCRAS